jgi:hypothetical protein
MPTEGTPDHFKKMLEGSCSNHAFSTKHLYKECSLMKRFLSGDSKMDQKKKSDPTAEDDAKRKEDAFLETIGCLMIFGGTTAYDSKPRQKLTHREVYVPEPATPSFL